MIHLLPALPTPGSLPGRKTPATRSQPTRSQPGTGSLDHGVSHHNTADGHPRSPSCPGAVPEPSPAWSLPASKPQRAKVFPLWMVKPLLTASPCDACAPFPAPCSWENTLSPQPHSIPLCLRPTLLLSFPRNAGIPPQFKHVGPHPDRNRTLVTSLGPASPALECAGSDFLGSTALCGFAPFPGRSQGKQRPPPLSSAAGNRGPHTESCKQKVNAITTFRFHLGEKTR